MEAYRALAAVVDSSRSPRLALLTALASTLACWWIYVPIHELLHAYACIALGGEVQELQVGRLYGGGILEQFVPFVRAGGGYAGRLSQFDTGGSDLVFLATDCAPYVPSVLAAFPLLRLARTWRSASLFGPGVVLLAAPLMSLTGDFYEMGSILISDGLRVVTSASFSGELASLRHDDLFALASEFPVRFPTRRWLWAAAVAASFLLGCVLATATLALARRSADLLHGERD